jgi:hypothetical protein
MLGKLTFHQVLLALEREILLGKTYLSVGKGLLGTAPEWDVFGVAPTFFGLTAGGSLQLAQMAVAKLYDRSAQSVNMKTMLSMAAEQQGSFQADAAKVNATILQSAQRVIALQPILDSIRKRRDRWLAHLDVSTVRSPTALNESAKLTIQDLERALAETEDIFKNIEHDFDRTVGEICFLGGDDYKYLLKLVRHAKAAEKQELQAALKRSAAAASQV